MYTTNHNSSPARRSSILSDSPPATGAFSSPLFSSSRTYQSHAGRIPPPPSVRPATNNSHPLRMPLRQPPTPLFFCPSPMWNSNDAPPRRNIYITPIPLLATSFQSLSFFVYRSSFVVCVCPLLRRRAPLPLASPLHAVGRGIERFDDAMSSRVPFFSNESFDLNASSPHKLVRTPGPPVH